MEIINRTEEILKKYKAEGKVKIVSKEEVRVAYSRTNEQKEPELEILPDCPICKTNNINHYCKRDSNGILGPGFYSWVVEEYYICKTCGIHFSKVENA